MTGLLNPWGWRQTGGNRPSGRAVKVNWFAVRRDSSTTHSQQKAHKQSNFLMHFLSFIIIADRSADLSEQTYALWLWVHIEKFTDALQWNSRATDRLMVVTVLCNNIRNRFSEELLAHQNKAQFVTCLHLLRVLIAAADSANSYLNTAIEVI